MQTLEVSPGFPTAEAGPDPGKIRGRYVIGGLREPDIVGYQPQRRRFDAYGISGDTGVNGR
jgi:hypothetical protein